MIISVGTFAEPITALRDSDEQSQKAGKLLADRELTNAVLDEARSRLGIQPGSAIAKPELNLNFHPLVISLGGLRLDCEPFSLESYFDRNREVYLEAKCYL